MSSDLDLLIGKWIAKVKPPDRKEPWTWEYDFQLGGRVTWQDLKSNQHGSGTWASTDKLVNIAWNGSNTRESWVRPLSATPTPDKTWYASNYFHGNYRIEKPVCPGFRTEGPFLLASPEEIYQTGLLCWAAGSASWLRATGRGQVTVADLVKKYQARGKLDADDALLEENLFEVFLDIGIQLKRIPAVDFTFCYLLEKLKTKGHLVILSGSGSSSMGHTRVVYGVGDPSNEFFSVFDPLKGHGYEMRRFRELSGNIYIGWAK
jgi:Papain-like cysteine protease AvrRpt2